MGRFNVNKAVQTVADASNTADDTTTPTGAGKSTQRRSTAKKARPSTAKTAGKSKNDPPAGRQDKPAGKKQPSARQRKAATAGSSDDLGTPLPNERQPKPPTKVQDRRLVIDVPDAMRRHLTTARADDDIPTTVRIRAMLELWQQDQRLRSRIDKLAKQRNAELIRHRWTTQQQQQADTD